MGLKKRVELAVLSLVAITALAEGVRIMTRHATSLRAFEAGGYLALLGGLLVGLAIVYGIREPAERWEGGQGVRWVLAAMALLVAYALALPVLGYLVSTALAFTAYLRIFSSYRWVPILAFAGGMSLASAWLWTSLAVILPQGILPWP